MQILLGAVLFVIGLWSYLVAKEQGGIVWIGGMLGGGALVVRAVYQSLIESSGDELPAASSIDPTVRTEANAALAKLKSLPRSNLPDLAAVIERIIAAESCHAKTLQKPRTRAIAKEVIAYGELSSFLRNADLAAVPLAASIAEALADTRSEAIGSGLVTSREEFARWRFNERKGTTFLLLLVKTLDATTSSQTGRHDPTP